ncbi:MAG: hypothetical protein CNIPEHKO_02508 [Anaerolineales bacterium]|nr:hypothetical protein [Anaerolineales bacterium]
MSKTVFLTLLCLVLAACVSSPAESTPTIQSLPTNTLAPTVTETPELTATFTVTPSPTVTVTPAPKYLEFPATLDLWLDEAALYCAQKIYIEGDLLSVELASYRNEPKNYAANWVLSYIVGEVVDW